MPPFGTAGMVRRPSGLFAPAGLSSMPAPPNKADASSGEVWRLHELAQNFSKASIRDVMETAADSSPLVWSILHRKLRGHRATYSAMDDVMRLTADPSVKPIEVMKALQRHRPFLVQPLCDPHPWKTYKKGRQIGVSELAITEVLWFLDTRKAKWIYTFPRDAQLKDFSETRVNETKQETPYMRALFSKPDQVYLKMIGKHRSHLFFRSAWESNLGEGIDGDGITFDEKDRMKEGIEDAFVESLSSSPYKWRRDVSTPTIPNRGVDKSYGESDQQRWLVRCVRCGTPQEVRYPENVIQLKDTPPGATEYEAGTFEYACYKTKCRGPLNRLEGQWVARFPDKQMVRGYMIPQTVAPWISATDLMNKKLKAKYKQLFQNYSLASCSEGEAVFLTEQHFEACYTDYQTVIFRDFDDWERVAVGVDWGAENWWVALGKNAHNGLWYVLNMGMVKDDESDPAFAAKEIIRQIQPLVPDIVVADSGYGKDRNPHLMRAFGEGRFFACYYNTENRGSRQLVPVWQNPTYRVTVDRTTSLKGLATKWRERGIGLCPSPWTPHFVKHHLNLVPRTEDNNDGDTVEIVDNKGPDHFAHAANYATIGLDHMYEGTSNFKAELI